MFGLIAVWPPPSPRYIEGEWFSKAFIADNPATAEGEIRRAESDLRRNFSAGFQKVQVSRLRHPTWHGIVLIAHESGTRVSTSHLPAYP